MQTESQYLNSESKYFYPLAKPTYGVDEVLEAIDSMVAFKTTMWDKVRSFELKFGDEFGGEAIMVNSGSSADLLIAFALLKVSGGELSPGDEILVPAVTWPTHLWSFVMAGFKVRLVDVSRDTLNFDLDYLIQAIGPKTRAISVVHLLGNMGNMDELRKICEERNLILLEDCCEALGSRFSGRRAGEFGLASSFSFFFSHHMVTMEGGMILTKNVEFARTCRLLRAHGWTRDQFATVSSQRFEERYKFVTWGFNVRPTELQGGFGLWQLKKLHEMNKKRNLNADFLVELLKPYSGLISTMKIENGIECNWFGFPMLIDRSAPFQRKDLVEFLEKNGVETRPIVAGNLARQPAMQNFEEVRFGELTGADFVHTNGMYIGIHPEENFMNLNRVKDVFQEFVSKWI
jgi:CDP-6-deoxy-D-xylo-4-hexulose-3-dehydrase